MGRLGRYGVGLAVLGVFAIVPSALHFDVALKFDSAIAAIFALAIMSLIVLTGYVGQISLCQATFMGISAFTTGWAVNVLNWNYWLAAPLGIATAFVLGVLVGLPALRLSGIMLAIVTVGVALVFDYYFFQDPSFAWFTGGSGGWRIDGASIGRIQLDSQQHILPIYWILLIAIGLVGILLVNMHDRGAGRRFRAIRDSEVAAATMGVDLTRYKLMGFGISAAIAGIAGAFFPLVVGQVSAQPFSIFYSLQFAAFAVLMGIRFVPAALLGGIFMSFVPEFLGRVGHGIKYDWFNVALGILLVVQVILAPEGVWGDLADKIGKIPGAGAKAIRIPRPERKPAPTNPKAEVAG
jgi:branched-chain amino acid transport system permease protein